MDICELSIRNILDEVGIYNCSNKNINAEIAAYGKGLSLILSDMSSLLSDAFIKTSSHDALNKREKAVRGYISHITNEEKKTLLTENSVIRGPFKEEIDSKLSSVGIVGNVIENYLDGIYLNIISTVGTDKDNAVFQAEKILPAHLPCYMDFDGDTWGSLDEQDRTFNEIDALDLEFN